MPEHTGADVISLEKVTIKAKGCPSFSVFEFLRQEMVKAELEGKAFEIVWPLQYSSSYMFDEILKKADIGFTVGKQLASLEKAINELKEKVHA